MSSDKPFNQKGDFMKTKEEIQAYYESKYPKTKDEVLKSVDRNLMKGMFGGLGTNGVFYQSADTFGKAIGKAVAIFCEEIHDLNPIFSGHFVVEDGCLAPIITEPSEIAMKHNIGDGTRKGLDTPKAGFFVWCSALNKASRFWSENNEPEYSQLCLEIMSDLINLVQLHQSIRNVQVLDEWEDILKKLNLQPIK